MQLSDALPLKFREAKDNYAKTLTISGVTTPRWKACNRFTDVSFTFATTLLYVNKHLPKNATKMVIVLIFCIRSKLCNIKLACPCVFQELICELDNIFPINILLDPLKFSFLMF